MKRVLQIYLRPQPTLAVPPAPAADILIDAVKLYEFETADYATLVEKIFQADSVQVW